jgi:heterodisulfide reductase subunit A
MAVYEFYSDMCVPGKKYQEFYEHMKEKTTLIRCDEISVEHNNGKATITYGETADTNKHIEVDMLILAPAMVPAQGAVELAKILGIGRGAEGFFGSVDDSPTESGRNGMYVAGCAQGPKDIGQSITQADAAAAKVLSLGN